MLANIITVTLEGLNTESVVVETDITSGLPALNIVGLPSATVKESSERIRSAIINSGYNYSRNRITVNLSPANMRKNGTHFDLPIALGVLLSSEEIKSEITDSEIIKNTAFIGELSLDGKIVGIKGALPMLLGVRNMGIKRIIVPMENFDECKVISGLEIIAVSKLKNAVFALGRSLNELKAVNSSEILCHSKDGDDSEMMINVGGLNNVTGGKNSRSGDFADIRGQEDAKRAMIIAAAGFHNVLMIGSPGAGKTMLASRLPGILPDMAFDEMLETTSIYSIAGELSERKPLILERPFRSPHHTSTVISLVGGGNKPMPGEISLAHNGVLFLDEILEFPRYVLESLRQPIEMRRSIITRNNKRAEFPAKVLLVAAANPCKCGYYGDPNHECNCTISQVLNYRNKLSGPMIDRIDLQLELPSLSSDVFFSDKNIGMSTADMKAQVEVAVTIQKKRFKDMEIEKFNAHMNSDDIKLFCELEAETESFAKDIFNSLKLSGRSYQKLLRVARTIADLEEKPRIERAHLAEAARYRLNAERNVYV